METAASQAGSEIRSYKGREGREMGITGVGEEGRWGLRGWGRKGDGGYRVGEEVVGVRRKEGRWGLQGRGGSGTGGSGREGRKRMEQSRSSPLNSRVPLFISKIQV